MAFNDVDLCYRIYELGYYNIQRNDVCLYHHESLSRGKDGESREKQLRLLKEKDILYERHQELYGQDPFYHPYLTTDMLESGYSPAFHYQVDLRQAWSEPREVTEAVKRAREDSCLVVGMECAMDIYKWKYGVASSKGRKKALPEDEGFYFQGYSFIIGADNAVKCRFNWIYSKAAKRRPGQGSVPVRDAGAGSLLQAKTGKFQQLGHRDLRENREEDRLERGKERTIS